MKNVLITGIGGPTPRSIAKTLRKDYPHFRIVGIDANPKALGFFMHGLLDNYYVAPKVTEDSYWSFIEQIIDDEKIDMAFVQPEVEVIEWGRFYKMNRKYPCPVIIPPVEMAEVLIDKYLMSKLLIDTDYIPKTIGISQSSQETDVQMIRDTIGFPCWIRAIKGSGGLGSLKVENTDSLRSWLFINRDINEFTVSEFLPGRHLATQMLYFDGEYIKGASLECVEYVMSSIAPSKVTGNTSFGRFINENKILEFCNECIEYISNKLNVKPHGVFSFDLKEDVEGGLKLTEVNIRHMAYTGVMASAGFDLIKDSVTLLDESNTSKIEIIPFFSFDKPYVFLRDVDTEPVLLEGKHVFRK